MLTPHRPLDQFLLLNQYRTTRKGRLRARKTHKHSKPVIWEYPRHEVEEVVVVLVQHDGLESDLGKERLDPWRELALRRPVFFLFGCTEFGERLLELRMEGILRYTSV